MRNGTQECPTCFDPECCSDEEWTDGECAYPENRPSEPWACCYCGWVRSEHDARCWQCGAA